MSKTIFDYSLLKGKIKEKYDTNKDFAKVLDMSESTISYKLSNKVGFSQEEIMSWSMLLSIPVEEINKYFFTIKV